MVLETGLFYFIETLITEIDYQIQKEGLLIFNIFPYLLNSLIHLIVNSLKMRIGPEVVKK